METDIPILVLEGTLEEMGAQYARAYRKEFFETIEYFSKVPHTMAQRSRLRNLGNVSKTIIDIVNNVLAPFIERGFTEDVKRELKGISEELGIDYAKGASVFTFPDIMLNLLGFFATIDKTFSCLEVPATGCTSLAAWDDATLDGKLVVGRNLDFFGVDTIADNPLLVVYKPDNGQNYVSVTSPGIPTAGVTALNESGITVAAHINLTNQISLLGTSMVSISNDIARNAHTLDEAVKIAKKYKAGPGFSLFVTSGDEKKAAVIEFSNKKTSVRYPDSDTLALSNHYHDPELVKGEIIPAIAKQCSVSRYENALWLMQENYGHITPGHMASFLGDRQDKIAEQNRFFGNTISQANTVQSVVMVPEDRMIYVAKRPVKGSRMPVSHGLYYGYALDELISGEFGERDILTGNAYLQNHSVAGQNQYYEWFISGVIDYYNGNTESALSKLKLAQAADEPFYHYVEGIIRIQENQDLQVITDSIKLGIWKSEQYLQSFGWYILGRAFKKEGDDNTVETIKNLLLMSDYDIVDKFCSDLDKPYIDGELDEFLTEYLGFI